MRLDSGRLFLTALMAVFLTACKTVTVEQPEEGAVLTSAPDIVLSFPKGQPDVLTVTLNGQDISSQFAVTDSGATASGSNISSYLVDGENHLKVVKPNTPLRKFFFDKSGPMVHITQVTGNLTISGYVEDPAGVASVTVNGTSVNLAADNSFTVTIANSNFVEFNSRDNNGYTRVQRFARPQVAMSDALGVRINRDGLNFLESEMEALLVSDDFGTLVQGFNPIKDDSILGNGYTIIANDATLGAASLSLDVVGSNGNFGLSGTFNDIWADVTVEIDPLIGWDFTIDGTITLARASFDADADLSASNGSLNVNVNVGSLDLDRIRTDINNFPDWLLVPFLEAFEWLFEIILKGQIEDIAQEKIVEFVDTFPSTLLFDINGAQMRPDITPEVVSSPNNGVTVQLGAQLVAVTSHGPAQVGSHYVGAGPMPAPTSTLPNGSEKDVGAVVSEDMINQALAAATASGMLNFTVAGSDIPDLANTTGSGDVRVRLVPTSAPVIDLKPNTAEGLGSLQFSDFYIAFEVIPNGQSNWDLLLGATLDVSATADLGITDDNAIAVDVIGVPSLKIRDIDDNSSLILNEAFSQQLIDEFTPIVLPIILNAIGAVPLPSFEGYGLNVGGMWVLDNDGHYVGVAGDMVKASVKASAAAPRTFATVSKTMARSVFASSEVSGEVVTIDLSSDSEGDVAYRYSLDGAPFGLWKNKDQIKLYNLKAGDHTVTVCARSALLVEDPDCDTVEFTVAETE